LRLPHSFMTPSSSSPPLSPRTHDVVVAFGACDVSFGSSDKVEVVDLTSSDKVEVVDLTSDHGLDDLKPLLEAALRTQLGADGCLADLVERPLDSLATPATVAPFSLFAYKLYSSSTATHVLRRLMSCTVPGTQDTFETVLSSISQGGHHCYLVGGQVRDIIRGVLSTDVDFNYSCTAQQVALICVGRCWPTKLKAIGPVQLPNYVLIGDEGSENYLEGFSISFNATKACYEMDFRQNMCMYDLTNDVIIDKTGHGVQDIRSRSLRLSCATNESYQAWAAATITPGFKELRYIKFLLRALAKGEPLQTDDAERTFVVNSLRRSMLTNADALRGFWFGYAMEAQLKSTEGVAALRAWVCKHGGQPWWELAWVPLVQASATPAIAAAATATTTGSAYVGKAADLDAVGVPAMEAGIGEGVACRVAIQSTQSTPQAMPPRRQRLSVWPQSWWKRSPAVVPVSAYDAA